MFDLVIRGGLVIDGTGAPGRLADVAITDGRVIEIGTCDGPTRHTIDATDRVVAPGFVDVHTHFDAQAFWDPALSPSSLHGVTTVFAGNCGFTIAPIDAESAAYVVPMLARVEGMSLDALEMGVPWDWNTTAEYLDRLEGRIAVNMGLLVGHSTVRRLVMRDAACQRTATEDELEAMRQLLRDGLTAGAVGFSSSWARTHNDAEGGPVPSRFSDEVELLELCSVLGDFDGTSIEFLPLAGGAFTPEVTQLLTRMSLAAQSPLNWNLINATAANQPETLARLEASTYAEEHGARVVALVTVSPNIGQYSFLNGFVLDAFPGWEEPMSLPPDEKLKLLADPEQRRRLLKLSQEGNPLQSYADWPTRIITETFTPETKQYEGRLVGEIAAEQGREAFDVLLDIVCADALRTTFSFLPPDDTPEEWAARRAAWEDPRTVVGGSDAGAHLDVIASYSYPTQLLAAVRKQRVLSLERAVQLLTSQPAELYGLRDRGRLVEGGAGDVVIFDPSTVGPGPVTTRFDLPGGAPRLYCDAFGIGQVIVNGEVIIEDGSYNDARPGRVLRRGRDTSSPAMSYDVSGAPDYLD